jgi:hypothetical protein
MRILSLTLFVLVVASTAMAAPETHPTIAICKSDLKTWSTQKTETLTIKEIDTRMDEMVACADMTKKHEKQMRAYLDEFYRTHTELANRTFDFITRHDLRGQFDEEEDGTSKELITTFGERLHENL